MDPLAAARYYVLYRLSERGLDASPTTSSQADLMACTTDGRRVVLVRVRVRERGGRFRMTPLDALPAGRNVAYVFVDFDAASSNEPRVFVVRGSLVTALVAVDPSWPREAAPFASFEDAEDGWHSLGLERTTPSRSPTAVTSSPTLA